MKQAEIEKELNELAVDDIKKNYNKSECERILEPQSEKAKLLQNALNENVEDGIKYTVTNGGVVFEKKTISTEGEVEMFNTNILYRHTIRIPYAYTMGKKYQINR